MQKFVVSLFMIFLLMVSVDVVYGQENVDLPLNTPIPENSDASLTLSDLILLSGTIAAPVSAFIAFLAYRVNRAAGQIQELNIGIQETAQRFKENELEITIRQFMIDLFHESIYSVYSKQISLVREVYHLYSDKEIDEFYIGGVEPKFEFKTFGEEEPGKNMSIPAITLYSQYERWRIFLETQRNKQFLFAAKVKTYKLKNKAEDKQYDYYAEFLTLRKNARQVTRMVREIMNSSNSDTLSKNIESFYKFITNELNDNVASYSYHLSNDAIIDPNCLTCRNNGIAYITGKTIVSK